MRELAELNGQSSQSLPDHKEAKALDATWRDLMVKLKGVDPDVGLQAGQHPSSRD
jgi:hypothetical protein